MSRRPAWVVMGVSGCGKSTVGRELAARLGVAYIEGDGFHSSASVAKMAAGHALDDADRADWLNALKQQIAGARARDAGLVLSCSALKRRYRDLLREADPGLRFAHLHGPRALLEERVAQRRDHFMPAALLGSQLAALEPLAPDEHGLVLDVGQSPAILVRQILASTC
jgi:carbohydrate kinase (thermoresistant glucokinase family)